MVSSAEFLQPRGLKCGFAAGFQNRCDVFCRAMQREELLGDEQAVPTSGTSRFSSCSAVDLPKEVRELFGFNFSPGIFKTIVLILRHQKVWLLHVFKVLEDIDQNEKG